MRRSGSQVYRDLRNALDDIQRDAGSLRGESRELDGKIRSLVSERDGHFLQLAQLYLPELSRPAVAGTFDDVREELNGVVARKEQAQREIAGRIERLERERVETVAGLKEVTNRLNEKVRERDGLQARLAELLKQDPGFQQLSKQALASEAELKRNEERVQEIERDAKEKLPAYERSRLFQYLYGRKFGTPEYEAGSFIRRLDRWVARLIGYERARNSYAFLTTTPALVRAEVDRRQGEFDRLMGEIEGLRNQAADVIGLTPVLKEGDRLGAERDAFVARAADVEKRIGAAQHEQAQLDQDKGTFYAEALGRFQRFLMKAQTTVLERQARATPDRTDDDIVSRIRWAGEEISRLQAAASDLVGRSRQADGLQEGLEFVTRRFQQSNFDSERSYFDRAPAVDDLVERFRSGALSREELWNSVRQNQKFEPTWVESNARDVVNHPLTGVLLHAMVEVAGAALQQSAHRSVARRSSSGGGGFGSSGGGSFPSFPSPPDFGGGGSGGGGFSGGGGASFGGGSSDGGFTSGEGF